MDSIPNPNRSHIGLYLWDKSTDAIKPVESTDDWGRWFQNHANRRIAQDEVRGHTVSTVCLGLDHSFDGGDPLIFETMVFWRGKDVYLDRYPTPERARYMHKLICEMIRRDPPPPWFEGRDQEVD